MSTDRDWRRWARLDPYYAVFSRDEFRSVNTSTRDEFFETGVKHLNDVLTTLRHHFGPLNEDSALDYGCGVGRVTIPLAQRFKGVTGIDVSNEMLAEATSNLTKADTHNVTLKSSGDALLADGKQFDLVHCYNVLQH